MSDADLSDLEPSEDHGSETLYRYAYQDLLVVPLCAEVAKGESSIVAIYPEFVEDIAVEEEAGWRFIQVKTHDTTKPAWTLSETIRSGALASLWRAHETVSERAKAGGISYQLGVWLSGPLAGGSTGKRDLIHVLAAHGERGRLVDRASWIARIQEQFNGCSPEEAEAAITDLVEAVAAGVKLKDGAEKRTLSAEEARLLVEMSWVEEKPSIDSVEDAARLGLHDLAAHLSKTEFDDVFDRLLLRIKQAASGSRERSQHARLFAAVVHGPGIGEGRRLQAEAKRLSREIVVELLAPLTRPPRATAQVDADVVAAIDTFSGLTATRLDYLQETSGTIQYYADRFVGREQETQEVFDFVAAADPVAPYLLVEAPAGYGKSTFVTHVIHASQTGAWPGLEPAVFFFYVRRRGLRNTAATFLQALNSQLLNYLGLDVGLPQTLDELRAQATQLWAAVQQAATPEAPVVLIVDGLDEMAPPSDAHPVTIADVLPVPTAGPVRVIVSSRPRPDARQTVGPGHPLADPALLELNTFDIIGVRLLLETVLARAPSLHLDLADIDDSALGDIGQRALEITGGEPLFLRLVADEVVQGGLGALDKMELQPPADAEDYFKRQFSALGEVAEGDTAWDVLGVLTVAAAGLGLGDIAAILGARRRDIRRAVELVNRFLIGEDRLELMHDRLHALVRDEFSPGELADIEAWILAWCAGFGDEGWPESTPDYALDQYAGHLERAGDNAALLALVSQERMYRHFARFHSYAGFVRDVEAALSAVGRAETTDWLQLMRCCYVLATLRSIASSAPPAAIEVFARLGREPEAVGYAELTPSATRRAEAFARIARAALDRSDSGRASELAQKALSALAEEELGELGSASRPLCDVLAELGEAPGLRAVVDFATKYASDKPYDWSAPALAFAADALDRIGEVDEAAAIVAANGSAEFLLELVVAALAREAHPLLAHALAAAQAANAEPTPELQAIIAACHQALGDEKAAHDAARAAIAVGSEWEGPRALAGLPSIFARTGMPQAAAEAAEAAYAAVIEADWASPMGAFWLTSALGDLANGLGKAADVDSLRRINEYVAQLDAEFQEHTDSAYSALAGAYGRLGLVDEAHSCLDSVDSDGSYEASGWGEFVAGLIEIGKLEEAEAAARANPYASRIDSLGLAAEAWAVAADTAGPDAQARALELAYLTTAGDSTLADEHYQVAALSAIASALVESNKMDSARRVVDRAWVEFGDSTQGTLGTVRPLIQALADVGDLARGVAVADQVDWRDYETLGPVASAAYRVGDLALAEDLLYRMWTAAGEEQYLSGAIDAALRTADVALKMGVPNAGDLLDAALELIDQEEFLFSRLSRWRRLVNLCLSHDRADCAKSVEGRLRSSKAAAALTAGNLLELSRAAQELQEEPDDDTYDPLPGSGEMVDLGLAYVALGDREAGQKAVELGVRLALLPGDMRLVGDQWAAAVAVLLEGNFRALLDEAIPELVDAQVGWMRVSALTGVAAGAVRAGDTAMAADYLRRAFIASRTGRLPFFSALEGAAPLLAVVADTGVAYEIFEMGEEIDAWFAPAGSV